MPDHQPFPTPRPHWLPREVGEDAWPSSDLIRAAEFEDVESWREGISGAFVPLASEALGSGPFRSGFQTISRGDIGLSRIEGSPQRVRRGPREIATTRGDFAYLNIQLAGVGQVRGGGGVRRTEPGHGAIVLADAPFELEFEGPFSQLCVAMPIDWVRDRLSLQPGLLAARPIDLRHGAGRVVRSALGALIETTDVAGMAQCSDLFALALDSALRPAQAHGEAHGRSLMPALDRLLARRLGDANLTPKDAAAALGCSVRTLHAACERDGRSFGRRLLDARLDASERALRSAPVSTGHVGQVAFACGFNAQSHFSRAFRARFGTSPGAYQASFNT